MYEKVGEYINIVGSVNASSDAVLEEFAEKSRKTGEFKGKFVKGVFTGTWSKPNGGKPNAGKPHPMTHRAALR